MNTKILLGALCAALVAGSAPRAQAQTGRQPPADAPPGRPQWEKHGRPGAPGAPGGPAAGLPPEERQRLDAAREKAKDDPTVRSLKDARDALDEQLEKAVNAALLAADPGLATTLEKVKQSRDRAKKMRERFESLSPGQRQQLKAARQKAKDDPAVAAAREKVASANSREERRAAGKAMHEAMKDAMIKEDPALAPLLEQLGPPPGGPGGPEAAPPGPAPDLDQ